MMKRLAGSDSLCAFISVCPSTEGNVCSPRSNNSNNHVCRREYQSFLDGFDEEGCVEELSYGSGEKKRRLTADQVKALEKNFEVENKLEPERKVKLAHELGLQPRQVAVWFQNRRARWKTKQLERDYGLLKANYDSLKLNYEALTHDHEALIKQISELKARLNAENTESCSFFNKGEGLLPETDGKELKNGSSDSDSSAILNDDNSSNPVISSIRLKSCSSSSPSSMNFLLFSKPTYSNQLVKIAEHSLISSEEACDFFSNEQPPTLQWFGDDQWSV